MSAQPNHLTVSPAKLEKADGYAGFIGNIAELVATGVTTFSLLPALFRHVADFAVRIDYHKVFIRAVQLLVLLSIAFATYKLVLIWQQYPGMAFLPFLDMHCPLMLFSGLFTANYIQQRDSEGVAIIALLSTMLNSLLV